MDAADTYLSMFGELEHEPARRGPLWVHDIRKRAIAQFAELGFPSTRLEDWRHTNVAPITKVHFLPARAYHRNGLTPEWLEQATLGGLAGSRLVVVDGQFSSGLSSLGVLPRAAQVSSLAAAIETNGCFIEARLGRYARDDASGFLALNTAFLKDGAFLHIPAATVVEQPIHVVFVSTAQGDPTVSHPRTLIVAEEGCQATIIESYVSLGTGTCFTNAVTELVAGEGAVIEHGTLALENESGFHVGALTVRQERASNVVLHSFSLSGGLVRNDVTVVLDGEGSECVLNGLFVGNGHAHVDNHTTIDHVKPRCTSQELYKGILGGKSTGVFNGSIRVRANAQKTSARQTNKNLLLSPDARINTKPQLEIFADDVKCNHGSTIGQLDADALFYLRARGIDSDAARTMLTYAFASEMISRLRYEPLRRRFEGLVLTRLPAREGAEES
ncbi:MAG: Fe-S cluster assembly protein SufD [Candidatus Binatia bacterium]